MKRLPIRTATTLATAAAVAVALMAVAPEAQARGGRCGDGPSPEYAAERLTRHLDLSDEQQGAVREILEQAFDNRRELRQEHRKDMDAMRQGTEARLAEVLTGEQMEELREMQRQRWGCSGGCDRGGENRNCDDCGKRGPGDCGKKHRNCRGPAGE